MGKGLFADEVAASAYEIPYDRLYAEGFRGIIYDIDNTLVFPDAPADDRAKELIEELKKTGYRIITVSNNKGPRVASFAEDVRVPYVPKAAKPSRRGYLKAMEMMGTSPSSTLVIGDQIYTDIWGGNRAGAYTILTSPFTDKEEIQIILKRIIEKPVMWLYRMMHHEN
ncbi:MAG: YqeG family HAD IIIA-type phosphatase [Lachnospiraceae bacterium]|nr:YqeG family HAD IIIA-type phosphatase [Lachnospiraceae bacterium]